MSMELPGKLTIFISSSLIVSSNFLLGAGNDKVAQQDSTQVGKILESLSGVGTKNEKHVRKATDSKTQAEKEHVKKPGKAIDPEAKDKLNEQSRDVSMTSDANEALTVEEEKKLGFIILDLSLNLEVDHKYENLQGVHKKGLSGVFDFDAEVLNFEMEPRFEWPHNENRERETTPDGIGIGLKIGI